MAGLQGLFGAGAGGLGGSSSGTPSTIAGGGFGFGAGGPSPLGGMDPSAALEMARNPMVQQMWRQMLDNPEMLRQMTQNNPMMRAMAERNPMLQQIWNNPELLRQMTSPEHLEAMSRSMGGLSRGATALPSNGVFGGNAPGIGGSGTAASFADMMRTMNSFSGQPSSLAQRPRPVAAATDCGLAEILAEVKALDAAPTSTPTQAPVPVPAAAPASAPAPTLALSQPPAASASNSQVGASNYDQQLQQLQSMGFDDRTANVAALEAANGDVETALGELLGAL